MLTPIEEEIVNQSVNEYIDGLRMDVIVLESTRAISEESSSRIVVIDKDFLLDCSVRYEVFFRNPVENYLFIPKIVDYYESKMILAFDRQNGFEITDFIDLGVIRSESVPLIDQRLTDDCLSNLIGHMCFDPAYQKLFPEVKTMIDQFFFDTSNPESSMLKNRIRKFLGC
jgi:hypothetical protein